MRKWLVIWHRGGQQDGLEHFSKRKPTRWAKARCLADETYTIEEVTA